MTVTTLESARPTAKPAPVVYLEHAQPLFRAVSNALLFTIGAKEDVPALRAVRFELETDGTLTVVACDRYRLFTETVEHRVEKGTEFAFSLTHDDAKQLATVLKGAGRVGSAMLIVEETRLRVQAGPAEIALRFEEAEYPKWRKSMPGEETADVIGAIALNPAFLGDLGKLKFATANMPARFKFFGHNKPVKITFVDGPTVWQMPIRIDEPAKKPQATHQENKKAA